MLQMWEFVLILIGAEVLVAIVTSIIVWKLCRIKRERPSSVSDEEKLHREADDIVMGYFMTSGSGVNIEKGHPPVSHLSSRSYDGRLKNQHGGNITTNIPNRVNRSWDPDLLNYHSKPRASEPAIAYDRIKAEQEVRRVSYPPPDITLTPFPESEYSSILRADITTPMNSESNYSNITSVSKSNHAHGSKRGSDVRSLNSIFLTSRPSMSAPSPFEVYSNSAGDITPSMAGASQANIGGHVRFESLWKD